MNFSKNSSKKIALSATLICSAALLAGCMTSNSGSQELTAIEQGQITPIDPTSSVDVAKLDENQATDSVITPASSEATQLAAVNANLVRTSESTETPLATDIALSQPIDQQPVEENVNVEEKVNVDLPGLVSNEPVPQVDVASIEARVNSHIGTVTGNSYEVSEPEIDLNAPIDQTISLDQPLNEATEPTVLEASAEAETQPVQVAAVQEPVAPTPAVVPAAAPEPVETVSACPTAQIQKGSMSKYQGGQGSANRRFTASIVSTSQKCSTQFGNLAVQLAVSGNLDFGPQAQLGQTSLPLKVKAVVDGKTVYSRVYTVKAWVSPEQERGKFAKILGAVQIPAEKAKDAQVFIGFDS